MRRDVLAGLTVAAYLAPQVMACAQVAELAPASGLWAAVVASLLYAALGSSRILSMGPESTTALMTAAALESLGGDPRSRAARAAALALLMGGVCLLARLSRLGFLAELLSKPVLAGYMSGVAIIMIAAQLGRLTRTPVSGESFWSDLRGFLDHWGDIHLLTLTLSAVVLILLILGGRRRTRVPIPLLAVLGAAAAVAGLHLRGHGVITVGALPAGLPALGLPDVSVGDLHTLLPAAVGLAVVGYSDNVLTARVFAAPDDHVDGDRELLALGAANLGAGLVGGFPVSASGTRTALGRATGGRSRMCTVTAAAVIVVAMLTLRQVLATIPEAALGALVVYAAGRMIDVPELRRLARFRRSELLLALLTTAAVLTLGVLPGIGLAVALSGLDLARRVARPHDAILGFVPGLAGMHDVDDFPQASLIPGLVVYRYDAPLCFANAADFRRRALAAAEEFTSTEWFVLNAEAVVDADITAIDILDEVRTTLTERGVVFALARAKQDLRDLLDATGTLDRIGRDRVFPTLPTAVDAYREWYRCAHGRPPVPPADDLAQTG